MNKRGYTTEVISRVYDDDTGEHIEVGPDGDTGDLLELRQVEKGKIVTRIVGYPEQMRLVAKAILELTEKPAQRLHKPDGQDEDDGLEK